MEYLILRLQCLWVRLRPLTTVSTAEARSRQGQIMMETFWCDFHVHIPNSHLSSFTALSHQVWAM